MLKLTIFLCLCAAALVVGQGPPPPPPPPPPPMPQTAPSVADEHRRVVRQSMPQQPPMQPMQGQQGGGIGHMGMRGLGHIPDPTAIIAKAQEVGRQFFSGRRRRQADPEPRPCGRRPPSTPATPTTPPTTTAPAS